MSHPEMCAAELLCDRHPADAVAFSVIGPDLSSTDLTYGRLRELSERCAAGLASLGVGPGDRVGVLMGKSVDLVVALLGIWRRGAVHVPLFTAFSRPAVELRLRGSGAKLVIAAEDQYAKVAPDAGAGRASWQVVVAGECADGAAVRFADLLGAADPQSPAAEAVAVGADGPFILMYTSGTTGAPKGVLIPLGAVASFESYLTWGLDLRPDDVYWNAADPGWAYGLYYAIVAPLSVGARSILLRAGFSAELTGAVLERFGVTNFAAAPTVYRALRQDPAALPPGVRLRCASAAGEPLTEEIAAWAPGALGTGVRDHYGQTELGMIILDPWHPDLQSSARPLGKGVATPGWDVDVLGLDGDLPAADGEIGRIAVNTANSPEMWFRGYTDGPSAGADRYTAGGHWYLTGDSGIRHPDGSLSVVARTDDVILMAGYRVGPSEVEQALGAHAAVAESAVIGAPDELRGEVVEAYVVLRPGVRGDAELAAELQAFVKVSYAAHAYPRAIHFVAALPKTASGKVQRAELRRRAAYADA